MAGAKTFGTFFRELRLRVSPTLRQFCSDNSFDPGNISKIERDVFQAPTSSEKLNEYAKALKLKQGSEDWINFFDLAAVSNKSMGVDKIEDREILNRLPNLFRTLENKELTAEQLDKLIEMIKRS